MTNFVDFSNTEFLREEEYAKVSNGTKGPLIIELGHLYTTIGFPHQKLMKIVTAMSRSKSGERGRVGNDLSYQEAVRSGRYPYEDGILLYTDVLKDLMEEVFEKILTKEEKQQKEFPYPVVFVISKLEPNLVQEYVRDIFVHFFNCQSFSFLFLEDLVGKNILLINFGYNDTILSFNDNIQGLSFGSNHVTLTIQQHLQAKYKFFAKNIDYLMAENIKMSACTFKPFISQKDSYEKELQGHYDSVLRQLQSIEKPIKLMQNLNSLQGRQDYSNWYGNQLLGIKSHFEILTTSLPFSSLFGFEQLKDMAEFAEKARQAKMQKILNLAHYQDVNKLSEMSMQEQLVEVLAYTKDRIQHYSYQLKQFERNKQINYIFENALQKVDFGDQYVDLQKVMNHLTAQFNDVSQANAICQIELADLGIVEQKGMQLPEIQYAFDGAASLNGNVIIPVFGEQFLAQEVYFNPDIIGFGGCGLVEASRNILPQAAGVFTCYLCGGGSTIPGLTERILQELQIFNCDSVELVDEFELISDKINE